MNSFKNLAPRPFVEANSLQSPAKFPFVMMSFAITLDLRKMWHSKRHTHREKRPGFLNGGGFKPRSRWYSDIINP
jgi:hypothetical protein